MNQILKQFGIEGSIDSTSELGSGLINDTYLVKINEAKYVLQKINGEVFAHANAIENNLKILYNSPQTKDILPKLYQSLDNKTSITDEEGFHWRLYNYEEGKAYQHATEEWQVEESAKAFGHFIKCTNQIDPDQLIDTIPNFHNGIFRLHQLYKAFKYAKKDKLKKANNIFKKVNNFKKLFYKSDEILKKCEKRVTHNDTKISNVLLDETERKYVCVIDLDTVMSGYMMYDFGDMVRTMCCTHTEDETDIDKLGFDIEIFETLCRGYQHGLDMKISKEEKHSLGYGGIYMALIMGIRFLTSHVSGMSYHKISYPDQNLDRCKNQLKLVEQMLNKQSAIDYIIEKWF